jgi:hypothetical protein
VRILILDLLNEELANHVLAKNVIYRPDVLRKGQAVLRRVLIESDVDAVVTRAALPGDIVSAWAGGRSEPCYYVSRRPRQPHYGALPFAARL